MSENPTATESTAITAVDVEEALREVIEPELGINVVDLGLVYGISMESTEEAVIDITLTSAACPLSDVIEEQIVWALVGLVRRHSVNWVRRPPWRPGVITDERREAL